MTALIHYLRSGGLQAPPPRPALKTASYALMHLIVAMAVAFALTGDWRAALAIGLVEPVVQTLAYTLHERAWARRAQSEGSGAIAGHQGAAAP
ncbi:MAG: DUF2061 domain-containing protein [Oceanicaulis sp.]